MKRYTPNGVVVVVVATVATAKLAESVKLVMLFLFRMFPKILFFVYLKSFEGIFIKIVFLWKWRKYSAIITVRSKDSLVNSQ